MFVQEMFGLLDMHQKTNLQCFLAKGLRPLRKRDMFNAEML